MNTRGRGQRRVMDNILEQVARYVQQTQPDFSKQAEDPSLEPFEMNRPIFQAAEKKTNKARSSGSRPLFSARQKEVPLDLLNWRNSPEMKYTKLNSAIKSPISILVYGQPANRKDGFYAARGK